MNMTAIATYKDTITETIDLTEDCHTYDDALDTFIYLLDNDHDIDGVEEEYIEIKLEEVPTFVEDWDDFEGFAPHYFNSHLDDISIWEAANNCDIPFSDVDEAYSGKWDCDEDFVENLLVETGDIPKLPHYIYIDWERTADAVMQDYEKDNGHYFRNL